MNDKFQGYDLLRYAIVEQEINDYLDLLARFDVPTQDKNITLSEKFFRSQWFTLLCDLDPEYVMETVRRKAKTMVLKYSIAKEKGSSSYYVYAIGDKTPIAGTRSNKRKALRKAAELNGLDYKDYMRVRRREGVKE